MKYPALLDYPEALFQETVVEHAHFRHWRVFFIPDWIWRLVFAAIRKGEKKKREKWSKPGFPDLVMLRPPRLIFAELKREGEEPRPEQWDWLNELAQVPCIEVYFWQPHDWDTIEEVLNDDRGNL